MITNPKTFFEQFQNFIEESGLQLKKFKSNLSNYFTKSEAIDTFLGKTDKAESAKKADTATSATKATQDASGNVISSTYATKTEVTKGLAGKANASHTHTTAQVTGLDTALAGKAPMSHTHTKSQITDFPTIPDTSTLIPKTGDRGTLRGYETATLLEGSAINNDSPDVMYGGSNIVVENGLDSTSWTKVLYDQLNYAVGDEPVTTSSITLGNKWGWAGGTVPTLGGGIIVLHWNKNAGVASFISVKK